jgi:6-pyruvoyl-tetrahydropterin synthase
VYTLCVSDFVMIAHSLAGDFFGPAQRLHGATLTVDAEIKTPELETHGVVMDIGDQRGHLRSVLEPLDYRNLDDHPAFPERGSTTERIARHLAEALSVEVGALAQGSSLKITVHESPVARVAYEREL